MPNPSGPHVLLFPYSQSVTLPFQFFPGRMEICPSHFYFFSWGFSTSHQECANLITSLSCLEPFSLPKAFRAKPSFFMWYASLVPSSLTFNCKFQRELHTCSASSHSLTHRLCPSLFRNHFWPSLLTNILTIHCFSVFPQHPERSCISRLIHKVLRR